MVVRDRLHDVLRLIERSADRDIEDIGVFKRIHLGALEVTHAAIGGEHKDANPLPAPHRVFGSGPGVAGRSAENIESLPFTREEMLEKRPEVLHRHVFEGERRAVRKLQKPDPILKPAHRRDVLRVIALTRVAVGLLGIGRAADFLQRRLIDPAREKPQHLKGEVRVRELPPGFERLGCHLRVAFRHEEAAVRRKPPKHDFIIGRPGRFTAGGEIADIACHVVLLLIQFFFAKENDLAGHAVKRLDPANRFLNGRFPGGVRHQDD